VLTLQSPNTPIEVDLASWSNAHGRAFELPGEQVKGRIVHVSTLTFCQISIYP
jgi:hypothetical protein